MRATIRVEHEDKDFELLFDLGDTAEQLDFLYKVQGILLSLGGNDKYDRLSYLVRLKMALHVAYEERIGSKLSSPPPSPKQGPKKEQPRSSTDPGQGEGSQSIFALGRFRPQRLKKQPHALTEPEEDCISPSIFRRFRSILTPKGTQGPRAQEYQCAEPGQEGDQITREPSGQGEHQVTRELAGQGENQVTREPTGQGEQQVPRTFAALCVAGPKAPQQVVPVPRPESVVLQPGSPLGFALLSPCDEDPSDVSESAKKGSQAKKASSPQTQDICYPGSSLEESSYPGSGSEDASASAFGALFSAVVPGSFD
eukprot:CAMPEP_0115089216 /NCGR_PEP_ID=MMETSP0227-20121206/24522_1 /TAXON_ID=89957 /ORGANISM="Polarella glacialis, Strain CCMP 1383" /LENGTH=310 /DNA_ID=CAMNT_0002479769 /DNA_START=151 /DNA_END=1083 /DNA_ORIENTATION=+